MARLAHSERARAHADGRCARLAPVRRTAGSGTVMTERRGYRAPYCFSQSPIDPAGSHPLAQMYDGTRRWGVPGAPNWVTGEVLAYPQLTHRAGRGGTHASTSASKS